MHKDDSVILTPFFLDGLQPGLLPLADDSWQINQPSLPEGERQQRMIAIYQPLAKYVTTAVTNNKRPVSIAGDCCATIGMLAGLQHAGINPTLLWFDAHGDYNTWETTPSGFLGGMLLAMIVGCGELTMAKGAGLTSLPESQVVLTDGRDLDPGERALVEDSALTHLPDVALLLEGALPQGPIYVHFDVDVLNLADVPAVSYPAVGGPTAAQLRPVFERLASSGQVTAISVSTWNSTMDSNGRSQDIVMDLISTLLA